MTLSRRARSVLAFFAQDTGAHNLVYPNADISKATQNREAIAFCDHWKNVSGADPHMLVMDQKVTTHVVGDLLLGQASRASDFGQAVSDDGGERFVLAVLYGLFAAGALDMLGADVAPASPATSRMLGGRGGRQQWYRVVRCCP
jgi:hypothetical protein